MKAKKIYLYGLPLCCSLFLLSCSGGNSGNSPGVDKNLLKGSWQESSIQFKNDNKPRSVSTDGYIDVAPTGTTAGPDLQKMVFTIDDAKVTAVSVIKDHADHSGVLTINYRTEGKSIILTFPDSGDDKSTINSLTSNSMEWISEKDNTVTQFTRVTDDVVKAAQNEIISGKSNLSTSTDQSNGPTKSSVISSEQIQRDLNE